MLVIVLIFSIKFFSTGKITEFPDSSKPSPRVIDVKCEKFYSNSLPKIELIASVKNFGEEGKITVVGEIKTEKNENSESKEISLKKNETKNVIFYFDAKEIISANCFARAFSY